MSAFHRALDALNASAFEAATQSPGATVQAVDIGPHDSEPGSLLITLELSSGHLFAVGFPCRDQLTRDLRERMETVARSSVDLACLFGTAAADLREKLAA